MQQVERGVVDLERLSARTEDVNLRARAVLDRRLHEWLAAFLQRRVPAADDRRRQRRSNGLLVFFRRMKLRRTELGQKFLSAFPNVRNSPYSRSHGREVFT